MAEMVAIQFLMQSHWRLLDHLVSKYIESYLKCKL